MLVHSMTTELKYGNRNVAKMIQEVEKLRAIIRAEGTPAIQDAWDKVESHIDYGYRKMENPNGNPE